MLAEAARLARGQRLTNTRWRHLRAEDLPNDLPRMDVVTFAQSLHWMDRTRVTAAVRGLLVPGGALVHVHATTHRGVDVDAHLPYPPPPWDAVTGLVRRYLGPRPRAGRGVLPGGPGGGEDAVYRAAGFGGPRRLRVPGAPVTRSVEQVFAAVHSLSSAAPGLFGDRLEAFDDELRHLLGTAGHEGRFSEQLADVVVDVWR